MLRSTIFQFHQQHQHVFDWAGLFDSAVEPSERAKEIANCINMAKDGIRALLLVLSLGSRFSEEEASAFASLCQIFGAKIADYMIVVFAHGGIISLLMLSWLVTALTN